MEINIVSGKFCSNIWFADYRGPEGHYWGVANTQEEAVMRVVKSIFCGYSFVGEFDIEVCTTPEMWDHMVEQERNSPMQINNELPKTD